MKKKVLTTNLYLLTLTLSLIAGCGGAGTTSESSGSGSEVIKNFGGGNNLGPVVVSSEPSTCTVGGACGPINICSAGHQQLLTLNISNIYMLDSSDKPLPYTQADLSETRTGTITVGSQTYNVSWLNVWFNQLFAPNAQNGSPFTRISYEATKDARYQVHPQSHSTGHLRFAKLEDVLSNPTSFTTITNYDQGQGLEILTDPGKYARFLDDQGFPKHAFAHPTQSLNWVSSTQTRKIIVVQFCAADLEDTNQQVDPTTGFRPLVPASSQPILIEVNEEVSPHLPKGFPN